VKNLFLAILSFALLSQAGCTCFQPAHRNDPGCAILNDIVDCTESAVEANVGQFEPVILQLIAKATGADGKIDWTSVDAGLVDVGVKDGGCTLAQIELDYGTPTAKMSASPKIMAAKESYHAGFAEYRSKRWPNVKFKVKKADGTTVLL
jgi:hypothetical protein